MDKTSDTVRYTCPKCKSSLTHLAGPTCTACGFSYTYEKGTFSYPFDQLLFEHFKNRYLLNKVLNNNAYISYKFLQEGSLSLPERADVQRFQSFLYDELCTLGGKPVLLDVGCGLLEIPGYLDFPEKDNITFLGIEPLDESNFFGHLIHGCSEFVPIENNSVDVIVFATSLDHVCSIEATLAECSRLLTPHGKIVIWMSDRSKSLFGRLFDKAKVLRRSFLEGYRCDRYVVYPNYTVLEIPQGAVDPYHSFFESPKKVIKMFKKQRFLLSNSQTNSKDEVFLTFKKSDEA